MASSNVADELGGDMVDEVGVVGGTVVLSGRLVVVVGMVVAPVVTGATDVAGATVVVATVLAGASVDAGATIVVVVAALVVDVVDSSTGAPVGAAVTGGWEAVGGAGSVTGGVTCFIGNGSAERAGVVGTLEGGGPTVVGGWVTTAASGTSASPRAASGSLAHHSKAAISRKSKAMTRPTTTSLPRRSSYQ
jgi:hypothetical protein